MSLSLLPSKKNKKQEVSKIESYKKRLGHGTI